MATATSFRARQVVFKRVVENHIHSVLLGALLVLTLAPFVGGVSYGIANMIVGQTPQARAAAAEIRRDEDYLRSRAANMDYETRQGWEQVIARKRSAFEKDQAGSANVHTELIGLFSTVQMAALALLFWSIAASPTAKLLVEAGAGPCGAGEKETRELLETLALSAGLAAPKLLVIETSVPNAFAAGKGPNQSVVAVTRGAIALLDQREMEGLLAHELSHIGNQDVQLNTTVAAIALFLRIPYLLFQRELRAGKGTQVNKQRNPWRLALSPVGLYILFVAPLIAAVIRAGISRGREFQADADAVKMTGSPQGLARTLAKIGGAGSIVAGSNPAFAHFYFASPTAAAGWLGGSLMATHPPVAERIQKLVGELNAATVEELKGAIESGRRYTREHPLVEIGPMMTGGAQDELASFNRGNPMGRVYRVLAVEPVPVYETPSHQAAVLTKIKPGALVVGFDDPGKMRQINTADQTFGYIERSVKLLAMGLLIPDEVYDAKARAAAEAALPPLSSVMQPETEAKPQGLTFEQILVVIGLGVLVFGGVFIVLVKFGH
jgi:heat shock protein HtpX